MDSMKDFLKKLNEAWKRFLKWNSMSDEERYLSKAVDLADLEERQRRIIYGPTSSWRSY